MANPFTAMLIRPYRQRRNNKKLNNHCADGTYENKYININGFDQYITIRGCHKNNPVLLFIHGGPGSSYTPFNVWLLEWEKHFTIVQWDQAGSGKTFSRNGTSQKLTFDILTNDGIAVTKYILNHLKKDKLVLLGSSVGSIISLKMIKQEPALFHAYVGADQNSPHGMEDAYQLIKQNTENCGDKKGLKKIIEMGDNRFKWSREQFDKLMNIATANCRDVPNLIYDLMLPAIMFDPDYTMKDIKIMNKGMKYAMAQLYQELIHFNFEEIGYEFKVPFFIFQGKNDCITPVKSAERYFEKITAPVKNFVEISGAGHLAEFCNPAQFLQELLTNVLKTVIEKQNNPS